MRKAKSTEERAENYCKLYHRFVNALEAVSPKLSPVGPALAYEFTFFGIFLDYVKKNNIKIHNAAGVYSIPIAEHTMLKVLELYKKSKNFYKKQENRLWEKEREIFAYLRHRML